MFREVVSMILHKDRNVVASVAVIVVASFSAGIILSFIAVLIISFFSSTSAILTDRSGRIFKVKVCGIIGDMVIISEKSDPSKTKEGIDSLECTPDLSVYDSSEIVTLEFAAPVAAENAKTEETLSRVSVVGVYSIQVTGFRGILSLYQKDGCFFGYMQFPQWAKGEKEILKNLRVAGRRVSFVRSVQTYAEQKRVGAPTFFVQDFDGEILDGGRKIKGFYTNHGVKEPWDGERK